MLCILTCQLHVRFSYTHFPKFKFSRSYEYITIKDMVCLIESKKERYYSTNPPKVRMISLTFRGRHLPALLLLPLTIPLQTIYPACNLQ